MSFIKIAAFALVATLTQSLPSTAHSFTIGELVIDHPYARATPPNAKVAGGYLTITNNGDEADRIFGASTDFAERVEIHKMAIENDVMKMSPVPEGVEIPARGSVQLMPGSFHLMFMSISTQLNEGDVQKVTLEFEKAGKVEVELSVEGFKRRRSEDMHKKKGMSDEKAMNGDMKMDHKAAE
ncbi:copper chaperone PCu(A)C [Pararhizobium sp. IMCC21322]|uniref:copper chaperone PCu(A)C n=1 Tax=Pararhizobium sp. IMCC21322 TaxID=3067903 RepID=UPI0027404984|nr:copper chaperone PCu(A)C [Pararhizobium sp. IMCC21322]